MNTPTRYNAGNGLKLEDGRAGASADAREALHGGHQLVELLGRRSVIIPRNGVSHAMAHVTVEDLDRDLLERGLHGGHLGEDVDAVGVLLDHALQAPHLSLDAPEPVRD